MSIECANSSTQISHFIGSIINRHTLAVEMFCFCSSMTVSLFITYTYLKLFMSEIKTKIITYSSTAMSIFLLCSLSTTFLKVFFLENILEKY